MLDSCRFLRAFVADRTLRDLKEDRPFRSAVERELLIIGEALYALSKTHPDVAEQLPEHARIIRFRHALVHGYDKVDQDIVWTILQDKLPILQTCLERLLEA